MSEIPDDLKSFIEGLLEKDPSHRLGCGDIGKSVKNNSNILGSPNDFEALKNHPFLLNKDFDLQQDNLESPMMKKTFSFSPVKKRGFCSFAPEANTSEKKLQNHKTIGVFSSIKQEPSEDKSMENSVLISLPAKRKKFGLLNFSGLLTMYKDGSIKYDQFFDKTSRDLTKLQILELKL